MGNFVSLMDVSLKAMTGFMQLMVTYKDGKECTGYSNSAGLWKLSYPHCMWYLPSKSVDFGLDIPPVCTNQPRQGYAFCDCHVEASKKLGVPYRLRSFLKHCGVDGI